MLCGSFLWQKYFSSYSGKKIYKMYFLRMIGNIHDSLYFYVEDNRILKILQDTFAGRETCLASGRCIFFVT